MNQAPKAKLERAARENNRLTPGHWQLPRVPRTEVTALYLVRKTVGYTIHDSDVSAI